MRSFPLDREVNVIVMGGSSGQEMGRAFQDGLADSTEITLPQWNQRLSGERVKGWFARLFSYWLRPRGSGR